MKKLYRPTGLKELQLIFDSGQTKYPPRLSWQPIFYPVLNFEYARQIAEEWNTKDPNSSYVGFVTAFDIDETYLSKFDEKIVGASRVHRELWVPSEELEEFNSHISNKIQVIDAYYGADYMGIIPQCTGLKDKDAVQQFIALEAAFNLYTMDFYCEITNHWQVVLTNFKFWMFYDFSSYNIHEDRKSEVLLKIYSIWKESHEDISLPGEDYVQSLR